MKITNNTLEKIKLVLDVVSQLNNSLPQLHKVSRKLSVHITEEDRLIIKLFYSSNHSKWAIDILVMTDKKLNSLTSEDLEYLKGAIHFEIPIDT